MFNASQMSNDIWIYSNFVYLHWPEGLFAPAFNNADSLFALVIALGFYLHHIEVADQDLASGSNELLLDVSVCLNAGWQILNRHPFPHNVT